MPTRIYSSGVFIADTPFLEAFAAFGKADERYERDNGRHNDKYVKHNSS
jgi:hypothetical protein